MTKHFIAKIMATFICLGWLGIRPSFYSPWMVKVRVRFITDLIPSLSMRTHCSTAVAAVS